MVRKCVPLASSRGIYERAGDSARTAVFLSREGDPVYSLLGGVSHC